MIAYRKIQWSLIISFILYVFSTNCVVSQTIYVDPIKGNDNSTGKMEAPFQTIHKAVNMAGGFSGKEPITIKLAPGLYLLNDQVVLDRSANDLASADYTIEALINPDDPSWLPTKMPVIESVSANNNNSGNFDHCAGFQIQRGNTHFRGLKFVGNSNPGVKYYYAIERNFFPTVPLAGMEVSQCLFVGSRGSAPTQGAIFAQGKNIHINHCIFYGCKNAVLTFMSITGFALTNSIIYGCYEGAIWFGKYSDFVFNNNIVANNNCFWVSLKDYKSSYVFKNSVIVDNSFLMGLNDTPVAVDTQTKPTMENIITSGKVILDLRFDTVSRSFLHPVPGTTGSKIPAGLFITSIK